MTIQTLLFPTDFSDCAEGAFSHAAFLAERFGATLHVLHVQEDAEADDPNRAEALTISPDDIYGDLRIPAEEQDPSFGLIDLQEHEVAARDVAASILHHASTLGADLIVMGTHGRTGVRRVALGSVAEAVTRHAQCPVLTVRPAAGGDESALRRVMVAVEEAAPEPPQVAWAARLAHAYGSRLDLVRVVAPSLLHPGDTPAHARGHKDLRQLEERLEADGLTVTSRVVDGDPADALLATAAHLAPDLLVVGSHGRTGVRRVVLGSVSERVLREAPCPVLVARSTTAAVGA